MQDNVIVAVSSSVVASILWREHDSILLLARLVNRAKRTAGGVVHGTMPEVQTPSAVLLLIDIVNCVCLKRSDTRRCNVMHSAAASSERLSVLTCGLPAGGAEGGHVLPGLRGVRQQGAQQARRYKTADAADAHHCCKMRETVTPVYSGAGVTTAACCAAQWSQAAVCGGKLDGG